MNLDYLKPGATIPITAEAIKYLVDVAKQLQADNEALQDRISDEEILALWVQKNKLNGAEDILDFARAILKKGMK